MKEFQQRNKFKKIFLSRPVFALFLCVAVLLTISTFKMYKKANDAVQRNEIIENELLNLEKRRKELEANVNRLRTRSGIEEELRKRFQVKKPGEEYIILLEEEGIVPIEPQKEPSVLTKILNFFR